MKSISVRLDCLEKGVSEKESDKRFRQAVEEIERWYRDCQKRKQEAKR